MIKKSIQKKITITFVALLILLITYLFPNNYESNNINQTLSYVEPSKSSIYLLDNKNMITKTETIIKDTSDSLTKAKQVINSLIINSNNSKYNSTNFKELIPENTKINSIDLKDNILKINFNENFLKVAKNDEEKMIESLIYSLTEIKDINGIMLFVNNELLTKLPNSNKELPKILDRKYGINKIYDIDDIKNITKTTVYYISEYNNKKYYTPVTFINNDSKDKIEIIIDKLKSSPINQTNLMSYLASSAELLDYEITEKTINLSFNNSIFDNFTDKNILEEVKYTIGLSILENYNVNNVIFNVDNKKIADFSLNGLE